MKIEYLPDSLLASLRRGVETNLNTYLEEETPWLNAYAKENRLPRPVATEIEFGYFPLLLDEEGKPLDDLSASKRIFDCFGMLTPVQARDERMWTWLTHTHGYCYTRARWKINKLGTLKKPKEFVTRRFFLTGGVGGLSRNALARLWWFAYLTHDPQLSDPYEYTGMLLRNQNINVGLFERNLGKNPEIVKRVVKHISAQVDSWNRMDDALKEVMKNLNCAGGAVVLDAVDEPRMNTILDSCIPDYALARD